MAWMAACGLHGYAWFGWLRVGETCRTLEIQTTPFRDRKEILSCLSSLFDICMSRSTRDTPQVYAWLVQVYCVVSMFLGNFWTGVF